MSKLPDALWESIVISTPSPPDVVGILYLFNQNPLFLVTCYATLHPAMSVGRLVGRSVPFWAASPKGPMTYAFTHMGNFLLLLLLLLLLILLLRPPPLTSKPPPQPPAQIPALGLISKPQGSIPSVMSPIPASNLQSQPPGSNLSLEAPIPASRLQSQP